MKKSNLALVATISTMAAVASAFVWAPAIAGSKEKCYAICVADKKISPQKQILTSLVTSPSKNNLTFMLN